MSSIIFVSVLFLNFWFCLVDKKDHKDSFELWLTSLPWALPLMGDYRVVSPIRVARMPSCFVQRETMQRLLQDTPACDRNLKQRIER